MLRIFLYICSSLPAPHSKLPYDVSNDQALEHEEVRQKVHGTIKVLQELADKFQQSIVESVDKIP